MLYRYCIKQGIDEQRAAGKHIEAGRGLGVIGAFAAAAFVWVTLSMPETPPPALHVFAGIYANPCCGSFTIGHGRLSTGTVEVPVETGLDKKGVFIIPEKYTGVVDGARVEIAGGFPMKLYVNRKSNPLTIEVSDTAAGTTYEFARTVGTARVR
jgi:hypothetical protein